jgi:hypothetical protein
MAEAERVAQGVPRDRGRRRPGRGRADRLTGRADRLLRGGQHPGGAGLMGGLLKRPDRQAIEQDRPHGVGRRQGGHGLPPRGEGLGKAVEATGRQVVLPVAEAVDMPQPGPVGRARRSHPGEPFQEHPERVLGGESPSSFQQGVG